MATKAENTKKTWIGGGLIATGVMLTTYSFTSNKSFNTASIIGITGVVCALSGLIVIATAD